MRNAYRDIAFTPTVLDVQEQQGSRAMYDRPSDPAQLNDCLGAPERVFLARCNSFYLSSVSETGWPYLQHRGGPPGVIRVLDDHTIGWAEFAGNRQYVTTGNLRGDDRVSIFIMDYANRARLKIFGHARVVGPDADEMQTLHTDGYRARIERGMCVRIAGFDWNCPQHIPELYSLEDVRETTGKLVARIAELEQLLAEKTGG